MHMKGESEIRVKDLIISCFPWPRAYIEVDDKNIKIDKLVSEPQLDSIPYKTKSGKIIYLKKLKSIRNENFKFIMTNFLS